jgi:hypothetical protein
MKKDHTTGAIQLVIGKKLYFLVGILGSPFLVIPFDENTLGAFLYILRIYLARDGSG